MYQMPKRPRQRTHKKQQHKKQKLRNILKEGKRLRNILELYEEQKLGLEEFMHRDTKEFLKLRVPMSEEDAKLLEILEIRDLLDTIPRTKEQQEMLDKLMKKQDLDVLAGLLDRNEEYVPVPSNLHLRF